MRWVVLVIVWVSILSGCSSFDGKVAAQQQYDRSLADFQNCVASNKSNPDACVKQRQEYEASTKVLTEALTSR